MAITTFEGVPDIYDGQTTELDRRHLKVTQNLLRGKTNNINELTLSSGTSTTTIQTASDVLTPSSYIQYMPLTANAATELASGSMYTSSVDADNQQFAITHTNGASGDRTFRYVVVG